MEQAVVDPRTGRTVRICQKGRLLYPRGPLQMAEAKPEEWQTVLGFFADESQRMVTWTGKVWWSGGRALEPVAWCTVQVGQMTAAGGAGAGPTEA